MKHRLSPFLDLSAHRRAVPDYTLRCALRDLIGALILTALGIAVIIHAFAL